MERLPDTLLLRRFLDGDELAFRALYRRHTPRLRALVFRMMGHRAEAEDVLQETWLSACRGIHTFRGESQFSTWLTTIGIRAVHARFRRSPAEALVDLPDDLRASSPPAAHHAAIDLERAIARLPDHQRMVLVLHDVEGFTHEEIGHRLEVATGTSKATLSRARRALRGTLTEGAKHGV